LTEGPEVSSAVSSPGPKGERTRANIVDVALRLFRERGYEATTMRAIAGEAGVSLGNAYYYFASKEHLIQAFYDRTQLEHARAAQPVLDREVDLTARITGVADAWFEMMEPYRSFAGPFFKSAADPSSPLSPFSPESAPARDTAIELWRQVVQGSDAKISRLLQAPLPELLWLYFMGTVLYWVYDPTEGAARTRALVHGTAPMVVRGIGLARLPVFRSTVAELIQLIADIKSISTGPPSGYPSRPGTR
jgi:AcrR family transcriptional regulator